MRQDQKRLESSESSQCFDQSAFSPISATPNAPALTPPHLFRRLLSVARPVRSSTRSIAQRRPTPDNPVTPSRISSIDCATPAQLLSPESDPTHTTAMLAHDLRNMIAALELYCDLLSEPGVLFARSRHYADDLRIVAAASRRLMDRITESFTAAGAAAASRPGAFSDALPQAGQPGLYALKSEEPICDLAAELEANRGLLTAIAGEAITLGTDAVTLGISVAGSPLYPSDSALAARIAPAEFTRLLVNLVRNAAEAMPTGGHIQIGLRRHGSRLRLTVADTGPGIPPSALPHIFSPGYSTHISLHTDSAAPASPPRGLGLAIVRSIATAAGGRVWAANRTAATPGEFPATVPRKKPLARSSASSARVAGAVLSVELPVAF